ncbi:MAG: hypothetical protein QOI06_1660 [Nocardioidaceae bacterium]|jgi:hypothetical protein|nr:hypothetical protein [Nocardioidaceae bacterium]
MPASPTLAAVGPERELRDGEAEAPTPGDGSG